MEISRPCQISKVNKPKTPGDYRPISVLPVLPKVYESVIVHQMTLCIEKKIIYYHYQSVYRKNHSTLTLHIELRDDIKRATKSREVILIAFVNYSRAFDTINFNILIYILHSLHFSKNLLYLILDYLSKRSHFVQINSHCSNFLHSKFGVPQGSVLVPVLFNLCVTDMKNYVPSFTCLQYADDCRSCANILTSELSNILTWSSNNNLAFNAAKMKAMLFIASQLEKLHGFEQDVVELKCRDKTLENVSKFTLFGITIDKNLN